MRRQMLWMAVGLALVGVGWIGGRVSVAATNERRLI